MKPRRICFYLSLALIFSGCSRNVAPPDLPEQADLVPETAVPSDNGPEDNGPAWTILAILETGAFPLWFEFSCMDFSASGGIRQIASPAEASLADFAPWPLAYYSAGMLSSAMAGPAGDPGPDQDSFLTIAVNRFGFISVMPDREPDSVVLYKAANFEIWDLYSAVSFFKYEGKPSVLLYRDDFFTVPYELPPEFPVQSLDEDFAFPVGINLPAFDYYLRENEWEAAAVKYGADGRWYYRLIQTGKSLPETIYCRTADLFLPGNEISAGEYRSFTSPETSMDDLPVLKSLAAGIAESYSEDLERSSIIPVLRIISPGFVCARDFLLSPSPDGEQEMLYGYCVNDELAFAVSSRGNGYACINGAFCGFTLPGLPEGFAYTGAGLAGNTFIATWEEQEEFSIGAAGFLALNAESAGLWQILH